MSETLTEGAKARLTRAVTEPEFDKERPAGFEFEIGEFVAAADPSEPGYADPDFIKVPFYYGHANGGVNNVCVPADAVELVMTAKQMRTRSIPTVADVRSEIVSALCGIEGDTFTTDEASPDGEHSVEVAGETHDGLRFAFTVQLTSLYPADF